MIHRQVGVGNGLGFHALGRIHDQESPFTGGHAARHFVGKVHVSRGIDQVELILLAVFGTVGHRHRVRLDRDAALALEIHVVEHLVAEPASIDRLGLLHHAVRECGLAVIDVGNDAEIAYMVEIWHVRTQTPRKHRAACAQWPASYRGRRRATSRPQRDWRRHVHTPPPFRH